MRTDGERVAEEETERRRDGETECAKATSSSLRLLVSSSLSALDRPILPTGIASLDALAPHRGFVRGAVHEILSDTNSFFLPALLARSAAPSGWIVWCDSRRELFPPGLRALGIRLDRLVVLRAPDELWAVAECLRCPAVAACVAALPRLSRVEARRIQLAAERGGGLGILLRPAEAAHWPYAAATRWLVAPARGQRNLQRWQVRLLHGHGGRVGQSVLLELCRETDHVRAIEGVEQSQPRSIAAGA
jgi:protein ImuA